MLLFLFSEGACDLEVSDYMLVEKCASRVTVLERDWEGTAVSL